MKIFWWHEKGSTAHFQHLDTRLEPGVNVSEYDPQSLVCMAKFLREFVHALPPKEMIECEREIRASKIRTRVLTSGRQALFGGS